MADNPAVGAASTGFNLTQGAGAAVGSGISTGADWAASKAHLDLQQQSLQAQKEQHDRLKQEWKVKVLTQQHDEYKRLLSLAPGQLKNDELKEFQSKWDQTPFPVDPSHVSAAKDQTYSVDIAKVLQELDSGIRITDPDAFNNAVATGNYFGQKFDPGSLAKISQGARMAQAVGQRLRNQSEGVELRKATNQRNAANDIHNDKDVSTGKNFYARVLRGAHNITDDMNVQTAHEVLQDFATALSGQNASSNFKIESISPKTLEEELTKLQVLFDSDPNAPAPPGLVAFLKKQAPRLAKGFEASIQAAAKAKKVGKDYDEPGLKDAADQAAQHYIGGQYFEDQKNSTFGKEGVPDWFSGKESENAIKERQVKAASNAVRIQSAIMKLKPGADRQAGINKAMAALGTDKDTKQALLRLLQPGTVIGTK